MTKLSALRPICYPSNEDIDDEIQMFVSDSLDAVSTMQDKAMNAIYTDRVKHGEDEED